MSDREDRKPRRVSPRKWAVATVAGLAAAQPVIEAGLGGARAVAEQAGEAGESGEAGITRQTEGPVVLLTQLGYFEGTYRIAAGLYLAGARDAARAHLDESHHAFYEDIAPHLAAFGAPGFEGPAAEFTAAIAEDASDEAVRAAHEALLAALDRAEAAAGADARARLMSLHELMLLAAAEYEGGVDAGKVEVPIEYRDSWGFYVTARARAEEMAAGGDAALAAAGRDVLARMEGIDGLFPGLQSETAAPDPSALSAAAGWIEIIALRQE